MFSWFKSRKKTQKSDLILEDLNGEPLAEGDRVKSLRYELGDCKLQKLEGEWYYVSEEREEKVSFIKMVDALSKRQKVLKINS